ncbi:MAG: aldehyde dehydrogenase [Calditrichaeota bacterium]|nr:MAG: aldehyde dehydrogenase [Calditrichota bacterium]
MQTFPKYPEPLISICPSTEQELGRIDSMKQSDIDLALANARNSLDAWSRTDIKKRQKMMSSLLQAVLAEKESIAELIAREQGKPVVEAMMSEVFAALGILKDLGRNARRYLKPVKMNHEQLLFAHKKGYYRFEPHGVIVVISPWNYPFSVPFPEIAAALVSGNTVVFKPAPAAVFIGKKIDELFKAADFPVGVLNTIFIHDIDAPYLTSHKAVDKIIFTGSTPVGSAVMCSASKQITPIVLELGGKDPAIISADANLDHAAHGVVWGSLFNAGQVCASIERVYVERSIADQFIAKCLQEIKTLVVGDPLDPTTQVGPMSTLAQLVKVQAQIDDAVKRGARLLCGGRRLDRCGYYMPPTLLSNVDHSMSIMTEETFGPVIPIMTVDSLDDAIHLANDSMYGLSAYLWTTSKKTAARFAAELKVGTVMINDGTSSWGEPNAPWGGTKKSGIGRTRSRFGLQELVQVKFVSLDWSRKKRNLWWYPYDLALVKFAYHAAEALYSTKTLTKMLHLLRVLRSKRFLKSVNMAVIIRNLNKLF